MNKLRRVTESESINTNCNDSCTNLVTTQPYTTVDSAPPTPYRKKLRRVTESEGINTNRPTISVGLVNAVPTPTLSCLVSLSLTLPDLVLSFLALPVPTFSHPIQPTIKHLCPARAVTTTNY